MSRSTGPRLALCGQAIVLEGLQEPGRARSGLQSGRAFSALPPRLSGALVPHLCEGRMTSVVFKVSSKQETLFFQLFPPFFSIKSTYEKWNCWNDLVHSLP